MVTFSTASARGLLRPAPTRCANTMTLLGLGNNTANVIMQLALPGVGRGVVESPVNSGSAFSRPIKRARTTGTYLAVAIMGTPRDKKIFGKAVHDIHTHVVSAPTSETKYSGNDPKLQLWVALCLFRYFYDQYVMLYGPLTFEEREKLLHDSASLGTTLHVRESMWPKTFAEFEKFWEKQLPDLAIDNEVRTHLQSLADLSFLRDSLGKFGALLADSLGTHYEFITKATLPAEFRELMEWEWTAADQEKFEKSLTWIRRLDKLSPYLGQVIYWTNLVDIRVRDRFNWPILGKLELIPYQPKN